MGNSNFFSKVASYDPLAHALHLPGANSYMNAQATAAAGQSGGGPYAGVAPSLAAANQGYVPGGIGSQASWSPFKMPTVGNFFQHVAAIPNTDPLAAAAGAPGAQTTFANPNQSVSGPQDYVQQAQRFSAARPAAGNAYGYGGY